MAKKTSKPAAKPAAKAPPKPAAAPRPIPTEQEQPAQSPAGSFDNAGDDDDMVLSTSDAEEEEEEVTDWKQSDFYKTLVQQNRITGIAYEVRSTLFPNIQDGAEWYWGEFTQWTNKVDGRVSIKYPDAPDTDTIEQLVKHGARFIKHPVTGKMPPKLKNARAFAPGPNLSTTGEDIKLAYEGLQGLGATRGKQVWKQLQDEQGVKTDNRKGNRYKPTINAAVDRHNTLLGMFVTLLPPILFRGKRSAHGQVIPGLLQYINERFSGDDQTFKHRKVTEGELLRQLGYYLYLCLETSRPVDEMWEQVDTTGENLGPPPNAGRHGTSKNRFYEIKKKSAFYSVDESGLDAGDSWRYTRPIEDGFNEHMEVMFSPGWLVELDESMFQWFGKVNTLGSPDAIANLSVVERKPTPIGAEVTTAACVLTKIIIRGEVCEGVIRHAAQEYYTDYGHSIAKSLRLTKPWHATDRAVAADSWFMGVNCVEAFRKMVSSTTPPLAVTPLTVIPPYSNPPLQ